MKHHVEVEIVPFLCFVYFLRYNSKHFSIIMRHMHTNAKPKLIKSKIKNRNSHLDFETLESNIEKRKFENFMVEY